MASETSALVTFVIALAGLVLSIISLLWQQWTWRDSGARVKARFDPGMTFGPLGSDRLYSLSLINKGRGPIQVTQYGLRTPRGAIMVQNVPDQFPKLPATLEGKHELTLLWTAPPIDEEVQGDERNRVLRPYAKLGDGRWVYAPERLVRGREEPTIVRASWWNRWWRARGRGLTARPSRVSGA